MKGLNLNLNFNLALDVYWYRCVVLEGLMVEKKGESSLYLYHKATWQG